jgi:hypothetical protein
MEQEPKSLQAAVVYFSNPDNCVDYLVARRWPAGVMCPTCMRTDVTYIPARRVWQCKTRHPKAQFSAKVGTIMEDSPISLDKWLMTMWMLANCKNGVSSYEIAKDVGVTQRSAWFMLQRIRLAMQDEETGGKLSGEVEIDETFIGGKARNMHKSKRTAAIHGRGAVGKAIVLGMLERGGRVKAKVIKDRNKPSIDPHVSALVAEGTTIMTDEHPVYMHLSNPYVHNVIVHAEAYVQGNVHTNGLENFWSLLKRGLGGTYVSVEPFHLFRYIDEQAFRFNNRATKDNPMNDADRFSAVVTQILGKRLTYADLTGKTQARQF